MVWNLRDLLSQLRVQNFYSKHFVYNSVAICLINTKLSQQAIVCVTMSCMKFEGCMHRAFQDVG